MPQRHKWPGKQRLANWRRHNRNQQWRNSRISNLT